MEYNPKFDFNSKFPPKRFIPAYSPATTTGIYTVLTILCVMRKQLGLEAMLDYMEKYRCMIEKNNPGVRHAVQHALPLVSVEALYKNATRPEKN